MVSTTVCQVVCWSENFTNQCYDLISQGDQSGDMNQALPISINATNLGFSIPTDLACGDNINVVLTGDGKGLS